MQFEGSTANSFETRLQVSNPTADRVITIPDITGSLITTGDTGTVTSTMIAFTVQLEQLKLQIVQLR